MNKILTAEERNHLVQQHRCERDKKSCDRLKAVLAYDDGYTYSEIAKILLLEDPTVSRHVGDYLNTKKLNLASGGSESKLTEQATQELREHLREVTYLYVKDIGAYYNRLKTKAGNREPIYFADSVYPQHQTQLTYGWILKGERKAIATIAGRRHLNIIGGICLNGHRFVYQQADRVNAPAIATFLVKLRRLNPGKYVIHLIWDNAGYHRDKNIQKFAGGLGIQLHYLPPYSPNLSLNVGRENSLAFRRTL